MLEDVGRARVERLVVVVGRADQSAVAGERDGVAELVGGGPVAGQELRHLYPTGRPHFEHVGGARVGLGLVILGLTS